MPGREEGFAARIETEGGEPGRIEVKTTPNFRERQTTSFLGKPTQIISQQGFETKALSHKNRALGLAALGVGMLFLAGALAIDFIKNSFLLSTLAWGGLKALLISLPVLGVISLAIGALLIAGAIALALNKKA